MEYVHHPSAVPGAQCVNRLPGGHVTQSQAVGNAVGGGFMFPGGPMRGSAPQPSAGPEMHINMQCGSIPGGSEMPRRTMPANAEIQYMPRVPMPAADMHAGGLVRGPMMPAEMSGQGFNAGGNRMPMPGGEQRFYDQMGRVGIRQQQPMMPMNRAAFPADSRDHWQQSVPGSSLQPRCSDQSTMPTVNHSGMPAPSMSAGNHVMSRCPDPRFVGWNRMQVCGQPQSGGGGAGMMRPSMGYRDGAVNSEWHHQQMMMAQKQQHWQQQQQQQQQPFQQQAVMQQSALQHPSQYQMHQHHQHPGQPPQHMQMPPRAALTMPGMGMQPSAVPQNCSIDPSMSLHTAPGGLNDGTSMSTFPTAGSMLPGQRPASSSNMGPQS